MENSILFFFSILKASLSLSPDVLRSLIGSALSDPASTPGGSSRDFRFSLPTQALQQLGDLRPDVWTLRLYTGNVPSCLHQGYYGQNLNW